MTVDGKRVEARAGDVVVDAGDIEALRIIPVLGVMPKLQTSAGKTTGPNIEKDRGARGVV